LSVGAQPSRVGRVVLRKNLARAIKQGHPWLYRDALRPVSGLVDGAVVMVMTGDGRPLARGFWDTKSPLAVRILTATDPEHADLEPLVAARVRAALDRRVAPPHGFIDRALTNAFRWVHGEADELPGVHVDLYGEYASLRFDGGGARAFYRGLPGLLTEVSAERAWPLRAVVERGAGTAAADGGALPAGEVEVRENGLRFGVDLIHGQKGGLFLDQRENRARVASLAKGRRVLNLFGYTGGFSLYAAAAGARATTTVDVAREALAAARRNFQRNSLPLDRADFEVEDAFAFLERTARAGERWDLVISDPPSFAPKQQALAPALRAYRRLHRLCASVTAPGGILCAASCSSHVGRAPFVESIAAGAAEAERGFTLRELHGAAADHPVVARFPEGDYLKFAVGVVA
jgi:23S rRNA (cytosine1962-C5)-methyltransferase